MFGVRTFQVRIRHKARPAMSWSRDEDHTQIEFGDDTIQMCINEA